MRIHRFHANRTLRRLIAQAFLFLFAAWLSACAGTSVESAWTDNVSRKQTFSRVLVVGISPNVDQRCPFERVLASKLKSESTKAFASCDAVEQKNPLTRESIEAAVAAKNADAVLATSLVSKQWSLKDGGTYDTRGGAYYKATDSYFGPYGAPVVYADFSTTPSIMTVQGEAHVTSRLYETHGATVVYTVDTKVQKVTSSDAGIAAITAPIGQRLRRDGLIR